MTSKIYIVQSSLSSEKSPKNNFNFQDESKITGKVLSQVDGKNYLVLIAGRKIHVSSEVPLKPSQIFTAVVSVKEKTVFFKLFSEKLNPGKFSTFSLSDYSNKNAEISKYLLKAGLPQSVEALSLLQFALSMGIRFDSSKIKTSLTKAFDDKKGKINLDKAKIFMMLEEKGIFPDEKTADAILGIAYEGSKKNHDENIFEKKSSENKKNVSILKSEEKLKDDVKNYFSSVFFSEAENDSGVLTLFNSLLPENPSEDTWIALPYEWKEKELSGVFRVLFSPAKKNIPKIVVDCKKQEKFYRFVLYFQSNRLNSVEFGLNQIIKNESKEKLKNFFISFLMESGIVLLPENFKFLPFENMDSFPSDNIVFSAFDGKY